MEALIPMIGIISVFGSGVLIISIVTNFVLKKKLIEKNLIDADTAHLFRSTNSRQNALKWGLIILSGGIGLIIISYKGLDGESAMTYGIETVSISIGFLAYYFLVKKENID